MTALTATCSIAVISAVAGYAGANEAKQRRDITVTVFGFILGSVLALSIVGAFIGYTGEIINKNFGVYAKAIAGIVLIFLGLLSLNLLPFKLPKAKITTSQQSSGILKAVFFGFILGGSSIICSVSCCNPILLVALGAVAMQGKWFNGAFLMAILALGYSIPLSAILLGVGFGKWTLRTNKAMPLIKVIAGIVLLTVGFYFLFTI